MTVLKKGFTLIELLIVIAILGVLAVVVLVAINPVQQLARTRDAGRISTVSQLGHAVEAYYTSHNGTYPPATGANSWSSTPSVLVSSGEINQVPGVVNNTLTTLCATNAVNGWCYAADADSFSLFSALEADTNLTIDAACGGASAFASYLSLAGRACIICDAAPDANTTDAACDN